MAKTRKREKSARADGRGLAGKFTKKDADAALAFIKAHRASIEERRFEDAWDDLHPEQQAIMSRSRWLAEGRRTPRGLRTEKFELLRSQAVRSKIVGTDEIADGIEIIFDAVSEPDAYGKRHREGFRYVALEAGDQWKTFLFDPSKFRRRLWERIGR
jgi:hypothetical protein